MISALEAHKLIQETQIPDGVISRKIVSVSSSLGLYLAEDIFAKRNQPPFNRSMMDGIALSSEGSSKREFKSEGVARAGFSQTRLTDAKRCIEVMTGAPVPIGCDIVVPYEEVINNDDLFRFQSTSYNPKKGQFIHTEASDYKVGDKLLEKGIVIDSTIISLLYSVGLEKVEVLDIQSIAIVSTGDELRDVGSAISPHQIYKSNPFAISSELKAFFPSINVELFHFNDDEDEVLSGLSNLLSNYKFIIISGGVSKGKYDYIPSALKSLGVKEVFHKVKQRPGKPLWFGRAEHGQVVFGLPGNPVSSLVNTRRHIIPLLESAINEGIRSSYLVKSALNLEIGSSFTHFLPVRLNVSKGVITVRPVLGNNSGDFSKLIHSDGFIEVPADEGEIVQGELYEFFPWGSLDRRLGTHGHE